MCQLRRAPGIVAKHLRVVVADRAELGGGRVGSARVPPLQPAADTEVDGMHAAVPPSRVLFLNPTGAPVRKRVALRPEELTGVPGPTSPAREVTLDLPAHSIRRANETVL